MFNHASFGGNMKASATLGAFNHTHAIAMGRMHAARLQAARALGGPSNGPGLSGPMPGMTSPPQRPQAASTAQMPPSIPSGPGTMGRVIPPKAGASFKQHVAHFVTHTTGQPVTKPMVHQAIAQMAQGGKITPFQAGALINHDGPLQGPQGKQTMLGIAGQLMSRSGFNSASQSGLNS